MRSSQRWARAGIARGEVQVGELEQRQRAPTRARPAPSAARSSASRAPGHSMRLPARASRSQTSARQGTFFASSSRAVAASWSSQASSAASAQSASPSGEPGSAATMVRACSRASSGWPRARARLRRLPLALEAEGEDLDPPEEPGQPLDEPRHGGNESGFSPRIKGQLPLPAPGSRRDRERVGRSTGPGDAKLSPGPRGSANKGVMAGTVSSALVKPKAGRTERLRAILPDIWALVGPRKWLLFGGFLLIAVQRLSALAPPYATKYLIDDVIKDKHPDHLPKVMAAVIGAAVVQSATIYAITQLFSRSTMRLTAELRCKLEAHVMRLSLLYHDRNKSGALGSRVMNDIAGLQNLVGPGFIAYIGSLMTSVIALALMLTYNKTVAGVVLVGIVAVGAALAFGTTGQRKLALERNEILADVVGRLQESLGGVRVVKAYRAEERERLVFEAGMQRMIENQIRSINLSSGLSRTTSLLWGLGGAAVLWIGAHKILDDQGHANAFTLGQLMMIMGLLAFMVQPLVQIVGMGTQLMEALAGLERTRALLLEPHRGRRPPPHRHGRTAHGRGGLRGRAVRVRGGQAGAPRRLLPRRAGHGHRARRAERVGQVDDDRAHRLVLPADGGARPRRRRRHHDPAPRPRTARSSASCCRRRSSSPARSWRTSPSRARTRPARRSSPPARAPASTSSPTSSRSGTTRPSASAASCSRAGSASASPSPARSSPTRAS